MITTLDNTPEHFASMQGYVSIKKFLAACDEALVAAGCPVPEGEGPCQKPTKKKRS